MKDIFVEAFDISDINDDKTIVEKLLYIVDKVNTEDIEAKKSWWPSLKPSTTPRY